LWNGTAASAFDLHPFLASLTPTMYGSQATGINADGSIIGYAYDASGKSYAVLWTPVPEPSTIALMLVLCGAGSMSARRSRQRCSVM
jgi:probable HAF family extracellular repeat protein